eukprot:782065-Pelagomonas_calceolata.AAC.3
MSCSTCLCQPCRKASLIKKKKVTITQASSHAQDACTESSISCAACTASFAYTHNSPCFLIQPPYSITKHLSPACAAASASIFSFHIVILLTFFST